MKGNPLLRLCLILLLLAAVLVPVCRLTLTTVETSSQSASSAPNSVVRDEGAKGVLRGRPRRTPFAPSSLTTEFGADEALCEEVSTVVRVSRQTGTNTAASSSRIRQSRSSGFPFMNGW